MARNTSFANRNFMIDVAEEVTDESIIDAIDDTPADDEVIKFEGGSLVFAPDAGGVPGDWTETDINDPSYIDNKPDPVTQTEAEAGTEQGIRLWSPLRVRQAVSEAVDSELPDPVSQSEAEAGTSQATRLWSPVRVHQAIDEVIESDIEAFARTSQSDDVPASRLPTADTSGRGILRLATDDEGESANSNSIGSTPSSVRAHGDDRYVKKTDLETNIGTFWRTYGDNPLAVTTLGAGKLDVRIQERGGGGNLIFGGGIDIAQAFPDLLNLFIFNVTGTNVYEISEITSTGTENGINHTGIKGDITASAYYGGRIYALENSGNLWSYPDIANSSVVISHGDVGGSMTGFDGMAIHDDIIWYVARNSSSQWRLWNADILTPTVITDVAAAPASNIYGMTYWDGSLWLIDISGDLYEIADPVNAPGTSIDRGDVAGFTPHGLTARGDNLYFVVRRNGQSDRLYRIDDPRSSATGTLIGDIGSDIDDASAIVAAPPARDIGIGAAMKDNVLYLAASIKSAADLYALTIADRWNISESNLVERGDFDGDFGRDVGLCFNGNTMYMMATGSAEYESVGAANSSGTNPVWSMASHNGSIFVVVASNLWEHDDPADLTSVTNRGNVGHSVGGMTSHNGSLWYLRDEGNTVALYELSDTSDPSTAVDRGNLPSGITGVGEMASHNGSLWFTATDSDASGTDSQLYELSNTSNPSSAVRRLELPFADTRIASHDGNLWLLNDIQQSQTGGLYRLGDTSDVASLERVGDGPGGPTAAGYEGMTTHSGELWFAKSLTPWTIYTLDTDRIGTGIYRVNNYASGTPSLTEVYRGYRDADGDGGRALTTDGTNYYLLYGDTIYRLSSSFGSETEIESIPELEVSYRAGFREVGEFDSSIGTPHGAASLNDSIWIASFGSGQNNLWEITDPISDEGTDQGSFPAALVNPRAMTAHNGSLWITDDDGNTVSLWELSNTSDPSTAVNRGNLPSGVASGNGLASHNGSLWIADGSGNDLWELSDTSDPSTAVSRGDLGVSGGNVNGMTSFRGRLWLVIGVRSLWMLPDPNNPGEAVDIGDADGNLGSGTSIVAHDNNLWVFDNSGDDTYIARITITSGNGGMTHHDGKLYFMGANSGDTVSQIIEYTISNGNIEIHRDIQDIENLGGIGLDIFGRA